MSQDFSTNPAAVSIRLTILVLVLLIGHGCRPKSALESHSLVYYQIRFDLPWKVDPQQVFSSRPKPPAVGFKLSNGNQVFELLNGQLKLNGKEYGSVKAGDLVKVTEDGKVFVNEEERNPNLMQQPRRP
jgi:hypothetical protein